MQDSAGLGGEAAEAGSAGLELAQLGQQAALKALEEADLLLLLLDSSRPLCEEDRAVLAVTENYPRLLLASKTDLPPAWPLSDFEEIIPVSVRQGELLELEEKILSALLSGEGEAAKAAGGYN